MSEYVKPMVPLSPEGVAWVEQRATLGWKPKRRIVPKLKLPRIGKVEKMRLFREHEVQEWRDWRRTGGARELSLDEFMAVLHDPKWKPKKVSRGVR